MDNTSKSSAHRSSPSMKLACCQDNRLRFTAKNIFVVAFLMIIFIIFFKQFNKTSNVYVRLNQQSLNVDCNPGVPCEYPDVVDFRIIVMTYNRKNSLLVLLKSLNDLYLDGDVASLEIWIDRNKTNGVCKEVVKCARHFRWTKGRVRVHVHKKHVGLYGQWIDTWRPRLGYSATNPSKNSVDGAGELVLILEDDLSMSKYAYRWLKAAHRFYANRTDIAGITLQSEGLIIASVGGDFRPPSDGVAYLYKMVGSWGFSPRARTWYNFQDWFHNVQGTPTFIRTSTVFC